MKSLLVFLYLAIGIVLCAAPPVPNPPSPLGPPAVIPAPAAPVALTLTLTLTREFLNALCNYLMFTAVAMQVSSSSRRSVEFLEHVPCPNLVNENLTILSSSCVALGIFLLSFAHGNFMSRYQIAGASISLAQLGFLMFWLLFGDSSIETIKENLSMTSEVTFYLPFIGYILHLLDNHSS